MPKKDIKKAQNLKYFETKITKLKSEREILLKDVDEKQKSLAAFKKEIKSLQNKIDQIRSSSNEIIFSEHAILRYIERVMHIDIEELKEKILPKSEREAILKTSKTLNYKKGDFTLKIQDGVVVTVLTRDMED